MTSKDTMIGIASRLESMSHDACLGHNDVHMTPQAVDALAKCIKDYVCEPERKNFELRYDAVHHDWWCTRCCTWYEEPFVYIVDENGVVKPHEMRYCPMCKAELVRHGR